MNQDFAVELVQILKEENEHANRLAQAASTKDMTIRI